jgi:hypothetical protein
MLLGIHRCTEDIFYSCLSIYFLHVDFTFHLTIVFIIFFPFMSDKEIACPLLRLELPFVVHPLQLRIAILHLPKKIILHSVLLNSIPLIPTVIRHTVNPIMCIRPSIDLLKFRSIHCEYT